MKVELDEWECERIVLALVQMYQNIPEYASYATMAKLKSREIALALKIDMLVREGKQL